MTRIIDSDYIRDLRRRYARQVEYRDFFMYKSFIYIARELCQMLRSEGIECAVVTLRGSLLRRLIVAAGVKVWSHSVLLSGDEIFDILYDDAPVERKVYIKRLIDSNGTIGIVKCMSDAGVTLRGLVGGVEL